MPGAISYNGNSLQTSQILTQVIDHGSHPVKNISPIALAHANKSVIPSIFHPNKLITVSGVVLSNTSIADLDNVLDTFRGYFNGNNLNLDIEYNGSTRRYLATATNVSILRPGGLLYAQFQVQFFCADPFGYNTSASTLINDTAQTSASYAPTCSFGGNAPTQSPLITYTLTDVTYGNSNLVTNSGFETDLSGYSSGGVGTATRVTTQFHSGAASMQIVNAGTAVGGNYGWELITPTGLTAGQAHTFRCWLKGNAGGEVVTVGPAGSQKSVTLTTSWQQVIIPFTPTSTSIELDFISTSPASGTWFVDDVSVTANSSGTLLIGNANTGQTISITRTWNPGDVVVIDTYNKTVTVNGQAVVWTGAFPIFPPGAGGFNVSDPFTTRSINFNVTCTPAYF